ncbi:MAG: DMT family transporter [Bacillota bacterium]|nr:DMT family transporter [Bacillota bacterium]
MEQLGTKTISYTRARVYIILVAIGYSTMGVAFKFVDWNPFLIGAYRNAFAFLCLGLYRKNFKIRLEKKVIIGASISYFCTTCFIVANKLTTSANAIVLQYTNPIFVLILSCWFLKKPFRKKDAFLILVMLAGIAMFFMDDLSAGYMLGNIFALMSGIGMAVSIMYACYSGVDVKEYMMLTCVISMLVGIPFSFTDPPHITVVSMAAIIFLGVVSVGMTNILYSKAVTVMPSVEVSMLLMLDPILNPILVAVFVREIPGNWAIAGAGIVILSMAANILTSSGKSGADAPESSNAEKAESN